MYGLSENVRGGKQTEKKMNRSINYATTTITVGGKKRGNKGDYCTEDYVFGQL